MAAAQMLLLLWHNTLRDGGSGEYASGTGAVFPYEVLDAAAHNATPALSAYAVWAARERVREMLYHALSAYAANAFPADELRPLSCMGRWWNRRERGTLDDSCGGYAVTLVDALSSLAVVGDFPAFRCAAAMTMHTLRLDAPAQVSVFESSIRVLGGLLSAHTLAADPVTGPFSLGAAAALRSGGGSVGSTAWCPLSCPVPCPVRYEGQLLDLAEELALRLLPAFDASPTGIPYHRIHLATGTPDAASRETCAAAAGTFAVEFGLLSRLTGRPVYGDVARRAAAALWARRSPATGLVASSIDAETGSWRSAHTGVGAGVDSFLEYLLKAGLLGDDDALVAAHTAAAASVSHHLLAAGVHVEAQTGDGAFGPGKPPVVSALQAFYPGLEVLAGHVTEARAHLVPLLSLWALHEGAGGLPEAWDVHSGAPIHFARDSPLRPELLESVYHLFTATSDPALLHTTRGMVAGMQRASRVPCGFAAVADTGEPAARQRRPPGEAATGDLQQPRLDDRLDSYLFAETLKYAFMTFDAALRRWGPRPLPLAGGLTREACAVMIRQVQAACPHLQARIPTLPMQQAGRSQETEGDDAEVDLSLLPGSGRDRNSLVAQWGAGREVVGNASATAALHGANATSVHACEGVPVALWSSLQRCLHGEVFYPLAHPLAHVTAAGLRLDDDARLPWCRANAGADAEPLLGDADAADEAFNASWCPLLLRAGSVAQRERCIFRDEGARDTFERANNAPDPARMLMTGPGTVAWNDAEWIFTTEGHPVPVIARPPMRDAVASPTPLVAWSPLCWSINGRRDSLGHNLPRPVVNTSTGAASGVNGSIAVDHDALAASLTVALSRRSQLRKAALLRLRQRTLSKLKHREGIRLGDDYANASAFAAPSNRSKSKKKPASQGVPAGGAVARSAATLKPSKARKAGAYVETRRYSESSSPSRGATAVVPTPAQALSTPIPEPSEADPVASPTGSPSGATLSPSPEPSVIPVIQIPPLPPAAPSPGTMASAFRSAGSTAFAMMQSLMSALERSVSSVSAPPRGNSAGAHARHPPPWVLDSFYSTTNFVRRSEMTSARDDRRSAARLPGYSLEAPFRAPAEPFVLPTTCQLWRLTPALPRHYTQHRFHDGACDAAVTGNISGYHLSVFDPPPPPVSATNETALAELLVYSRWLPSADLLLAGLPPFATAIAPAVMDAVSTKISRAVAAMVAAAPPQVHAPVALPPAQGVGSGVVVAPADGGSGRTEAEAFRTLWFARTDSMAQQMLMSFVSGPPFPPGTSPSRLSFPQLQALTDLRGGIARSIGKARVRLRTGLADNAPSVASLSRKVAVLTDVLASLRRSHHALLDGCVHAVHSLQRSGPPPHALGQLQGALHALQADMRALAAEVAVGGEAVYLLVDEREQGDAVMRVADADGDEAEDELADADGDGEPLLVDAPSSIEGPPIDGIVLAALSEARILPVSISDAAEAAWAQCTSAVAPSACDLLWWHCRRECASRNQSAVALPLRASSSAPAGGSLAGCACQSLETAAVQGTVPPAHPRPVPPRAIAPHLARVFALLRTLPTDPAQSSRDAEAALAGDRAAAITAAPVPAAPAGGGDARGPHLTVASVMAQLGLHPPAPHAPVGVLHRRHALYPQVLAVAQAQIQHSFAGGTPQGHQHLPGAIDAGLPLSTVLLAKAIVDDRLLLPPPPGSAEGATPLTLPVPLLRVGPWDAVALFDPLLLAAAANAHVINGALAAAPHSCLNAIYGSSGDDAESASAAGGALGAQSRLIAAVLCGVSEGQQQRMQRGGDGGRADWTRAAEAVARSVLPLVFRSVALACDPITAQCTVAVEDEDPLGSPLLQLPSLQAAAPQGLQLPSLQAAAPEAAAEAATSVSSTTTTKGTGGTVQSPPSEQEQQRQQSPHAVPQVEQVASVYLALQAYDADPARARASSSDEEKEEEVEGTTVRCVGAGCEAATPEWAQAREALLPVPSSVPVSAAARLAWAAGDPDGTHPYPMALPVALVRRRSVLVLPASAASFGPVLTSLGLAHATVVLTAPLSACPLQVPQQTAGASSSTPVSAPSGGIALVGGNASLTLGLSIAEALPASTGRWLLAGKGALQPSSPQPLLPVVAVVMRGRCSFMDKALAAQAAGADALVVVDGDSAAAAEAAAFAGTAPAAYADPHPHSFAMVGDGGGRRVGIPSAFIGGSAAAALVGAMRLLRPIGAAAATEADAAPDCLAEEEEGDASAGVCLGQPVPPPPLPFVDVSVAELVALNDAEMRVMAAAETAGAGPDLSTVQQLGAAAGLRIGQPLTLSLHGVALPQQQQRKPQAAPAQDAVFAVPGPAPPRVCEPAALDAAAAHVSAAIVDASLRSLHAAMAQAEAVSSAAAPVRVMAQLLLPGCVEEEGPAGASSGVALKGLAHSNPVWPADDEGGGYPQPLRPPRALFWHATRDRAEQLLGDLLDGLFSAPADM